MKRKKILTYGILVSILLFILAGILFNDVSFDLIGIGIIIIGIVVIIYMNYNK